MADASLSWSWMISKKEGTWDLKAGSERKTGRWFFDKGKLYSETEEVGTPKFDPISSDAQLNDAILEGNGSSECKCIRVCSSEIMKEIQDPVNAGAYFVLPSQLNGAEYPSNTRIIQQLEDYKYDNTGGPRGQLAVHPAAGQFVLDNAASDNNPTGINAIDEILKALAGTGFDLKNGYLKIGDPNKDATALNVFKSNLHTLRPLVMKDVLPCGVTPSKGSWSEADHRVSLVYASAVPVGAYLNRGMGPYELKVAEMVLTAQYYGALKFAAENAGGPRAKVYLMPLGGGVFNNPWDLIAKGMAKAVELLETPQRDKLDINVLAWSGNPNEERTMTAELTKLNKLQT